MLGTAPCSLISPGQAYCYDVIPYGYMVVGYAGSLANSLGGIGGGRRRRRLLSVANESTPLPGDDDGEGSGGELVFSKCPPSMVSAEQDEALEGVMLFQPHRCKELFMSNVSFNGSSPAGENASAGGAGAVPPHYFVEQECTGWTHVAEPCRSLALDVLDRELKCRSDGAGMAPEVSRMVYRMPVSDLDRLLRGCVFWRTAGNGSVEQLNLTAVGREGGGHYLMSWQDLADVATRKGVLLELYRAKGLLRFVIGKALESALQPHSAAPEDLTKQQQQQHEDGLGLNGSTLGAGFFRKMGKIVSSILLDTGAGSRLTGRGDKDRASEGSNGDTEAGGGSQQRGGAGGFPPDLGGEDQGLASLADTAESVQRVAKSLFMPPGGSFVGDGGKISRVSHLHRERVAGGYRTEQVPGSGMPRPSSSPSPPAGASQWQNMQSGTRVPGMVDSSDVGWDDGGEEEEEEEGKAGADHVHHRRHHSASQSNVTAPGGGGSRSLLQQQQQQQQGGAGAEDVYRYSSLTASQAEIDGIPLKGTLADTWLQGPFSWPPKFKYWEWDSYNDEAKGGSCAVATVIGRAVMQSSAVMNKYYTTDYVEKMKQPPWSLAANVPSFTVTVPETTNNNNNNNGTLPDPQQQARGGGTSFVQLPSTWSRAGSSVQGGSSGNSSSTSSSPSPDSSWVASYYDFVIRDVLGNYLGITPSKVQGFLSLDDPGTGSAAVTLGSIAKGALVCDFESVIMCTEHKRNIVMALIVSYGLYWIASTVLVYILGIRGGSTILFVLVFPLAWWLAYGISPMCGIMIPTCALRDIIDAVQVVLPAKISWPNALQEVPGCAGSDWWLSYTSNTTSSSAGAAGGPTGSAGRCLKSCRGEPFYFRSWESTVAWAVCSTASDPASFCADIVDSSSFLATYFPGLREAAYNHSVHLQAGDQDMISAFTFCSWITLAQAVPWVFLAVSVLHLAAALLAVPFEVASAGVQVVVQAVAYTHCGRDDDDDDD